MFRVGKLEAAKLLAKKQELEAQVRGRGGDEGMTGAIGQEASRPTSSTLR